MLKLKLMLLFTLVTPTLVLAELQKPSGREAVVCETRKGSFRLEGDKSSFEESKVIRDTQLKLKPIEVERHKTVQIKELSFNKGEIVDDEIALRGRAVIAKEECEFVVITEQVCQWQYDAWLNLVYVCHDETKHVWQCTDKSYEIYSTLSKNSGDRRGVLTLFNVEEKLKEVDVPVNCEIKNAR